MMVHFSIAMIAKTAGIGRCEPRQTSKGMILNRRPTLCLTAFTYLM
jgi:hypothetical protein